MTQEVCREVISSHSLPKDSSPKDLKWQSAPMTVLPSLPSSVSYTANCKILNTAIATSEEIKDITEVSLFRPFISPRYLCGLGKNPTYIKSFFPPTFLFSKLLITRPIPTSISRIPWNL